MLNQTTSNGVHPAPAPEGITKITVGGFKSLRREQSIEIRPLTLLAGANSSGKSSIMQPLLLMKQTLEAPYDPGALLLNGPNVKFTSAEQLFFVGNSTASEGFSTGIQVNHDIDLELHYAKEQGKTLAITQLSRRDEHGLNIYRPDMRHDLLTQDMPKRLEEYTNMVYPDSKLHVEWSIISERCFFQVKISLVNRDGFASFGFNLNLSKDVEACISEAIHLPGLRGNPARTYPVTAVGSIFPGTFDNYTASVIAHWQLEERIDKLEALRQSLSLLGLTNAVSAKSINDTQVELRVGRTQKSNSNDMVSIADVGFGVSQTLPVLVALLAAKPGQIVYLEQPEIHLHPRAQTAMAQALAEAALRGVRVVAETHSSLLLLGVQTLVAEGKLPPDLVKLHWFTRDDAGATTIQSTDLDAGGAFGDWPEDFGEVTLDAQDRFLNAAERHLLAR